MEDTYRTIEKPAEGIYRDRNSRFLAFGYPVETTDQVHEILGKLKKKYHDARHHCYAYRIGPEKEAFRMHDDGEPSGTAGKPIYNQLVSHRLANVLIVVVRYFGGTLLGAGGLINAYRSAAGDMISKACVVDRYLVNRYHLSFPYEKLSLVMKVLKDENVVHTAPEYDVNCTLIAGVRRSLSDHVLGRLSLIGNLTAELIQND
jgi:uncharacterized YigZ family protein